MVFISPFARFLFVKTQTHGIRNAMCLHCETSVAFFLEMDFGAVGFVCFGESEYGGPIEGAIRNDVSISKGQCCLA